MGFRKYIMLSAIALISVACGDEASSSAELGPVDAAIIYRGADEPTPTDNGAGPAIDPATPMAGVSTPSAPMMNNGGQPSNNPTTPGAGPIGNQPPTAAVPAGAGRPSPGSPSPGGPTAGGPTAGDPSQQGGVASAGGDQSVPGGVSASAGQTGSAGQIAVGGQAASAGQPSIGGQNQVGGVAAPGGVAVPVGGAISAGGEAAVGGITPPAGAIVAGDILITEVLANPSNANDRDGEWFELHNATNRALSLDGCRVIRVDRDASQSLEGVNLASNAYIVLVRKVAPDLNGGIQNGIRSSIDLVNDPFRLAVECNGAVIDDQMIPQAVESRSQQRVNGAWQTACDAVPPHAQNGPDRGTPGAPNTPCP